MSLQLALDQIQRPTWWFENEPPEVKYQRHGKVSGTVKQNTILAHIKSARRMDCNALIKTTGYTAQSIRYHTAVMIDDGQIRRIDCSNNRVFWEAVKP